MPSPQELFPYLLFYYTTVIYSLIPVMIVYKFRMKRLADYYQILSEI